MQHRIELGLLERGAFGHLLPLERAPPVAPPLHGQKLQRGAAARRFVLLHPAAAFPGRLCPGARAVRAECAAEAKQPCQGFGAGSGEENLSARTLDVPNIVRRFGGPNSAKTQTAPTSQGVVKLHSPKAWLCAVRSLAWLDRLSRQTASGV